MQEIPLGELASPGIFRNTPERFVGAGTVVLERERGAGIAWEWVARPDEARRVVSEARSRYGRR